MQTQNSGKKGYVIVKIFFIACGFLMLTVLFAYYTSINVVVKIETTNCSQSPIVILILAYQRSGSTFVGDLLQQNEGTFYHYEPLHYLTVDEPIDNDRIDEALSLILSLVHCNFNGRNIPKYLKYCMERKPWFLKRNIFLDQNCDGNITERCMLKVCKKSPVHVLKIVRLRMEQVRRIILLNPSLNIKVLHLLRDPRGIIRSRRIKPWCKGNCLNPEILCQRMLDDVVAFHQLQVAFPGMFFQVRYEDISEKPFETTKTLCSELNIPFSERIATYLKKHTQIDPPNGVFSLTQRNSSQTANAWKTNLTTGDQTAIFNSCFMFMQKFGY